MYLVISLLVLRVGCGIWLYQFLIIAYLFTLLPLTNSNPHSKKAWIRSHFYLLVTGNYYAKFGDEKGWELISQTQVFVLYRA